MENYWLRIVDLLQANKYIEGIPYWKYKEMKTARGDKKKVAVPLARPLDCARGNKNGGGATVQSSRLRSRGQREMFRCQVEPFDSAQDRLRRNLFDRSIELKVFVQTSRLRSRGQECARGNYKHSSF